MRIHLCGVRGSTPAPGAEFVRYGGHTSCVAIAPDDTASPRLILDAGTGLRRVTAFLRPDEVTALASFGHPAADYAVSLARQAGVGQILLAHHKPDRTDDELDELDEIAARFRADPHVTVAAEGQVIDL